MSRPPIRPGAPNFPHLFLFFSFLEVPNTYTLSDFGAASNRKFKWFLINNILGDLFDSAVTHPPPAHSPLPSNTLNVSLRIAPFVAFLFFGHCSYYSNYATTDEFLPPLPIIALEIALLSLFLAFILLFIYGHFLATRLTSLLTGRLTVSPTISLYLLVN